MYSLPINLDRTGQKFGVVLLFRPTHAKKRSEPCIFCGDTLHLQTFKGKIVCSTCLQDIHGLFVYS